MIESSFGLSHSQIYYFSKIVTIFVIKYFFFFFTNLNKNNDTCTPNYKAFSSGWITERKFVSFTEIRKEEIKIKNDEMTNSSSIDHWIVWLWFEIKEKKKKTFFILATLFYVISFKYVCLNVNKLNQRERRSWNVKCKNTLY